MGWISYHDETYFEQVKSLPPAHNLIFHNNTVELDTYWVLEKKELNLSYEQAVDAFKSQFFERLSKSICALMLKRGLFERRY